MLAARSVNMTRLAMRRVLLGLWRFMAVVVTMFLTMIAAGAVHMTRKPVRWIWTARV